MEKASLLFCLWAGLWCCCSAVASTCKPAAAAAEAAATRCSRMGAEQSAARARPGCRLRDSVVSMYVVLGGRWEGCKFRKNGVSE